MPKSYKKKKAGPKAGPKYRTPDNFRSREFGGKKMTFRVKPTPPTFRVQHKG